MSAEAPVETDPVGARMSAALQIAATAGRIARGYFETRDSLTIESKGTRQDLVSQADREVETAIRADIRMLFPGDGLIGEEHAASAGTTGFDWVIDPIDGTSPFLSGQPNWCVSIAVTGPSGIVAGVIECPVHSETFSARAGHGAFLNGRRLRLDPLAGVTSGNIGFGVNDTSDPEDSGRFVQRLLQAGGVPFRVGSGAIMLAYVAAGRLAGYYDPAINAWDCYAGNLLVEEAGGIAVFDGGIGRKGPLWAGSSGVVAAMRGFANRTG